MILASASLITVVPRALRMNLFVRLIMPWRLPACAVLILPVAVTLNRFLQLDLVFSLGISGSLSSVGVTRDSACHFGRPRSQSAPYTRAMTCLQGPFLAALLTNETVRSGIGQSPQRKRSVYP